MLQGAVDKAIDGAADRSAALEAGRVTPDVGIAARLAAASERPAPNAPSAIFTPSGRRLDVQYEVVDAGDLIASHGGDMAPNPRFPRELQPRDRTRAASEIQVNRIAGDLQPERLGASTSAMEGAPIVGPDGIVESGNARVLGIMRAYEQGGPRADAYRQFLRSQGFNADGMRAPVLVRRRVTDLSPQERVGFTQESNISAGLSLSASERAENCE